MTSDGPCGEIRIHRTEEGMVSEKEKGANGERKGTNPGSFWKRGESTENN